MEWKGAKKMVTKKIVSFSLGFVAYTVLVLKLAASASQKLGHTC